MDRGRSAGFSSQDTLQSAGSQDGYGPQTLAHVTEAHEGMSLPLHYISLLNIPCTGIGASQSRRRRLQHPSWLKVARRVAVKLYGPNPRSPRFRVVRARLTEEVVIRSPRVTSRIRPPVIV
ncbi:DNA topoisomerase 3-beta [Frankliniella fusca]|uniref:DNA topoisomerase 3-beta n=1 Tax=Frankliniella fusca TaxID=407009 RepID=A0AAE1HR94_9NEOP|nr:DNA topoisomerase 3-beta [Frankliniella fusca]